MKWHNMRRRRGAHIAPELSHCSCSRHSRSLTSSSLWRKRAQGSTPSTGGLVRRVWSFRAPDASAASPVRISNKISGSAVHRLAVVDLPTSDTQRAEPVLPLSRMLSFPMVSPATRRYRISTHASRERQMLCARSAVSHLCLHCLPWRHRGRRQRGRWGHGRCRPRLSCVASAKL
ncbi:hypothetical protein BC834DRAFT_523216 [Gloeopeniophorella convolvens]|nr:hypothetical protein BC834DRAFT_523216 [Gloeopeniophorella convolvens]